MRQPPRQEYTIDPKRARGKTEGWVLNGFLGGTRPREASPAGQTLGQTASFRQTAPETWCQSRVCGVSRPASPKTVIAPRKEGKKGRWQAGYDCPTLEHDRFVQRPSRGETVEAEETGVHQVALAAQDQVRHDAAGGGGTHHLAMKARSKSSLKPGVSSGSFRASSSPRPSGG